MVGLVSIICLRYHRIDLFIIESVTQQFAMVCGDGGADLGWSQLRFKIRGLKSCSSWSWLMFWMKPLASIQISKHF